MKKLPIGYSDFKTVVAEEFAYLDKSLFIKDVIDDSAQVLLLPRPRRFGKTLNLSMLKYFFEIPEERHSAMNLFQGLAIEQEDLFPTHCGTYPVIFLTFKDVKERSFEDAFASIKTIIAEEFRRHQELLSSDCLSEQEKIHYHEVIALRAEAIHYRNALKDLSGYLSRYYQQKTVILIDEYDTLIHAGFFEDYYDESVAFFRSFLGGGLKDNMHLFKGVLTGILRVARESIFSGLNNIGVYSLLNQRFSTHFGLTEHEVQTLLDEYGFHEDIIQVREWYNGYIFGSTTMYNPWSILNYIHNHEDGYRPYWANTSSNQMIRDVIATSPASVRTEFQDLLQDIPLQKHLDENIIFPDITKHERAVYSFLVFSGYLKAFDMHVIGHKQYHTLLIPNLEVKQIFEDVLMGWITDSYENRKLQMLLQALIHNDIEAFEEILSDFVLSTLSYFDTQRQDVERVYQAFMLGLLIALSPAYELHSNKESGFGRYDISVIPKDLSKRAIIMELKKIGMNETKEIALDNALKQIEDKKYETDIRKRGIRDISTLAVTFDGKRVWVKAGSIAQDEPGPRSSASE
ncbi:MAG: AAA family ATPase [bacterium]|nr:AAA family ATPase [bacterium]